MKVNGIAIDDTFAEAFGMAGTGVIITADTMKWARQAAVTMSGFSDLQSVARAFSAGMAKQFQ